MACRHASGWRRGIELVNHLADDPRSELQAMLWGPRFDREQALRLLTRWPRTGTTALHVLQQAADRWDHLSPTRQARLRRQLVDNERMCAPTLVTACTALPPGVPVRRLGGG